jgi:chromosome segregation ATPase
LANTLQNLGRAKEIGEFVKHGASEAVIEIELAKGRHHNTNPVIRRRILKEGNKSAFAVNGRQSSQKDVVRLAKSFSIQIDNLCQFLPQDRVVEFAGLSPVALLRETLRAAAPEEMVQWHEQLKELRSDEKRLEVEQKNTDEHFRLLQTKQKATEHDVRQWNERQELVTKAKALEKCRPIIESNVIKRQIGDIKNQRDVARAEAQQLQAEIAPTQEAVGEVESYRDQISEVKIQRKAHVDKATEMAKRLETNIKAKQEAIAEYGNQVDAEKSGEKERRKEVKRLEAAIAAIERDMQNAPVEVDEDSFKARLAEMRSEKSSADRRLTQVDTDMQGCQRRAGDIRRRRDETKSERARLNTQSGKQANILERISKDTAIGWRWVEEHRDELRFKGKVSGPPILTCSVTDQRFADIVETQFGGFSDATAITCTDSADARLLSNKLLGNEGPRLHQITIRTIPQSLAAYRPPVTREELQGYGFEGWILDYIQGPDEVLAMLCESAQLHRAAYSPKPLSNEQHSAAEQSPIQSWIAGREKYQVKKRYGQASTRVVQVKTSQFFTDRPIDAEQTRQLDDAIRDLERDTMELKEEHTALKVEQKKLNDGLAQVNNEMVRNVLELLLFMLTLGTERAREATRGETQS